MRTTHVCISLTGALRNWRDSDYVGAVTDDNGKEMEPWEVKAMFLQYIAEGKSVIPCDSSCDNFDYQKGCLGHEVKDGNEDDRAEERSGTQVPSEAPK